MTFEVFSEGEVRQKYRTAQNKAHMLRVLAELTCSTEEQMAKFLGVEIQTTKGKINNAKAHKLYKKKMSDAQMAAALGVSRQAVHDWRIHRGLPQLAAKPDDAARMEVYNRGLSDRKAGQELGLSREAFRAWRHKNGLAPNNKKEITI